MRFIYSAENVNTNSIYNGTIETKNADIAKLAIKKYMNFLGFKYNLLFLREINDSIDNYHIVEAIKELEEKDFKKFKVQLHGYTPPEYGCFIVRGKDIVDAMKRHGNKIKFLDVESWEEVK